MELIIGKLPELVDNFAGNILSYALVLAAVATITMTFVELFKAVFKGRLFFHKGQVKKWLGNQESYEQLLILTVAEIDSADALFDQPTDKMMAQVQAAANVAIDFPDLYPGIYNFFTKLPSSPAAAEETGGTGRSDDERNYTDAAVWASFVKTQGELGINYNNDSEIKKATQARARIDHFVSRKLDAFQTRAEYKWARLNQYLSVVASSVFLVAILYHLQVPLAYNILLSFFGGMMAPLAKDVVSALSGLKTK